MKLSIIIDALKQRAPTFQGRIAGAASYAGLKDKTRLKTPSAYVIPLDDDDTGPNQTNTYRQTIADGFAVVVVLNNDDERGQKAYDNVDLIRSELWSALLAWQITDGEIYYDRLEYDGAKLLNMDRSRLDYQFEFHADMDIDQGMTYLGYQLAQAPAFDSVHIELDHKDIPPDGDIDHTVDIPIQQ